ncbi:L,D-transpeptidase family protein [Paracoccus aerodenitrificans]|uniref:L,D-transpeptidase family protein n=1 Tax=Paracoccus aerodenitrificans TaxID=3017781 RepID=UPI0022F0D2F2|nr:L,D-transpeptidase family protein [Paracoccus aerodenitrificans]WBU65498.1 L,D-transpeptidase family protein [Paracoccus aerodenitrificans]
MRRNFLKLMLGGASLLAIAGCGGGPAKSKFKTYNGPPVTRVELYKSQRMMRLFSGTTVLKQYDFGLGFAPVGNKLYEGDGKTPEGLYYVDRRNPNSRYYLSVGINYPNEQDKARALAAGVQVGSDIFIHGQGPEGRVATKRDWTAGCIAVTDDEIEDIYAMVKDGTPVMIYP